MRGDSAVLQGWRQWACRPAPLRLRGERAPGRAHGTPWHIDTNTSCQEGGRDIHEAEALQTFVCAFGHLPFCEGGQGPGLSPHGQSLAGAAHALSPSSGSPPPSGL